MEDLGLETESLLLAKKILYVEGIGGQINSGEWERLAAAQRLPGFNHLFVWKRDDAFLLGKLYSSSDGKGRSSYPMIACAHCQGIPLGVALKKCLPVLESFEQHCKATRSAEEVRRGLARAAEVLQGLAGAQAGGAFLPNGGEAAFATKLCPAGNDDTFLRVLYQLHAQCPPGGFKSDADWAERAVRLRVPAVADCPIESLLYWSHFLQAQFRAPLPIFVTIPLGECWLDALIGRPKAIDFYPLLARREVFAIMSEVAYGIEPQFRGAQAEAVQRMRTGTEWFTGKPSNPPEKTSWILRLISPD